MTIEKAGLKFNIQKTKIMSSSPISSWQIEEEKVETVIDFIFLDFKTTADGDCSYDKPRQHIKKKRHHLADKGPYSQSYGFFSSHCERWTIKKAELQRIDAFEFWCWRRLLRVPWTASQSQRNQSINQVKPVNPKEINPEYSLEGLMLKLKLQSFGHLM